MFNYFIIGLVGISLVSVKQVNGDCFRPSVLIVSFDGFRHDYLTEENTPNMVQLRTKGTHADYMTNVFPTKTFPNHHSLATGVYAELHGVLGNQLFDPNKKAVLKYDEIWNYHQGVVPIWILNEQSEDDCHSGVMMWPGSEMTYQNTTPKYIVRKDSSVTFRSRVDTIVGWFNHPTSSVNLVVAYFDEPDHSSHNYGPDSEQALKKMQIVDDTSQYIYDQLVANNLTDVTVFIVSDHGMQGINKSTIVKVGEKIEYRYTAMKSSPLFHIWPHNLSDLADVEDIYNTLKKEADENKHFSIYRKSDMPDEWHIKNCDRTPPILALAHEGYGFQDLLTWKVPHYTVDNMTWGVHGYDNKHSSMWPFFMAWGPQIKVNYKIDPFKTIDLYPLWSHLLRLDAPETDGSINYVKDMLVLVEQDAGISAMGALGIALLIICIVAGGLLIAYFVRRADRNREGERDTNTFSPERPKPEDNPLLNKGATEQATQIV